MGKNKINCSTYPIRWQSRCSGNADFALLPLYPRFLFLSLHVFLPSTGAHPPLSLSLVRSERSFFLSFFSPYPFAIFLLHLLAVIADYSPLFSYAPALETVFSSLPLISYSLYTRHETTREAEGAEYRYFLYHLIFIYFSSFM